jgi:hypothetical protein
VTRTELLLKLSLLNAELSKHQSAPLFDPEVVYGMSKLDIRRAIHLTEDKLMYLSEVESEQ